MFIQHDYSPMLRNVYLILCSSFLLTYLYCTPTATNNISEAFADKTCEVLEGKSLSPNIIPLSPYYSSENDPILCQETDVNPNTNTKDESEPLLRSTSTTTTSSSSSGSADTSNNSTMFDEFGTIKIYPTKENGREWHMNTSDPRSDTNFITDAVIEKQPDGAWRVSAEHLPGTNRGQVRIEVNTSEDEEPWKNVEITGYAKVVETTGHHLSKSSDLENIFQWYARGGEHNNEVPCEGTSLKGRLYLNGEVSWIKEIWHTGGYTEEKSKEKVTPHLVKGEDSNGHYGEGRWFGFKVVLYNTDEDKSVRMEMFLDERLDNKWLKVNSLVDSGNWYSNSTNFFDADCGRPRNYVVTNSGPLVGFRTDYVVWEFKNLSIREIDPLT